MKKLSLKAKLHMLRKMRKYEKRNKRHNTVVKYQLHSYDTYNNKRIKLVLPRILSLEHNYEEFVGFLNEFRDKTCKGNYSVHVDFTTVQKVYPDAALVLAAELDRWSRIKNIRLRVKKIEKWDPVVKRLFWEMGLFELLDVANKPNIFELTNPDVKYIQFKTHNSTEGIYARELRESLEKEVGRISGSRYLFNGLTEAMTNVMHHAYPAWSEEKDYLYKPVKNQWWLSGSVNREENSLTALFYDQGVGIPKTLHATYPSEVIAEFFSKLGLVDTDASRIKAAINLGRTSTGKANRGRGLLNIRQFIAKSKKGSLRILSNKGEYAFYSDGNDKVVKHRNSIGGTLIEWLVYL